MDTRWIVAGLMVGAVACSAPQQPYYGPSPGQYNNPGYGPGYAQPMQPNPNERVTLQTWCGQLGSSYCQHCSPTSVSYCLNSFVPTCLSNRSPTMLTERTNYETQQCGAALQMADCRMLGGGTLPDACRAGGGQVAQPSYPSGGYGGGYGGGDEPVTFQVWCGQLGRSFCTHCQPDIVDNCMSNFVPSCLQGRSPSGVTNRTASEVQACGSALQQAPCGDIIHGQLPYACQPRN